MSVSTSLCHSYSLILAQLPSSLASLKIERKSSVRCSPMHVRVSPSVAIKISSRPPFLVCCSRRRCRWNLPSVSTGLDVNRGECVNLLFSLSFPPQASYGFSTTSSPSSVTNLRQMEPSGFRRSQVVARTGGEWQLAVDVGLELFFSRRPAHGRGRERAKCLYSEPSTVIDRNRRGKETKNAKK